MVEDESGLRVPLLERGSRLPAHVAEYIARTRRLDDRPIGADEGQRSGLVNEDPVQHERRQAECVIAVEVGEEHDIDARRLHAPPMHVRQEWCARVEQHPSVDNDCAVISLGGEGGPRAKKGKFQATVTAGLRYTSWIACRSSIPSFIGRWNDLRPLIRPMPP